MTESSNIRLSNQEQRRLAALVRDACVHAALRGYERAATSGLCHDGAWEAAIGAIRMVDIHDVLREFNGD